MLGKHTKGWEQTKLPLGNIDTNLQVYRDVIRKTKAHLESNLAKGRKENEIN